jgi:hypothetical protein
MQGRSVSGASRRQDLPCATGARRAVRDGMDVLILRCGTCGREVGVTDEELLTLRTIDCWMCTEPREGRCSSTTPSMSSRVATTKPKLRGTR